MDIFKHAINCRSNEFNCICFSFSRINDIEIIECLVKKADDLAKKVNSTLARDSQYSRSYSEIKKDCIGGIFAEYCWRTWLNRFFELNSVNAKANETIMEDTKNQIDIEVIYDTSDTKTIEVRSSFAYKGVDAAVCRNFKIIGPYYNSVKTFEYTKDYHVMAIYSFNKTEIFNQLNSEKFKVYLTGGATRKLLQSSPNAFNESLIPRDDISASLSRATYKVIKPIVNGFDTIKISELISDAKP